MMMRFDVSSWLALARPGLQRRVRKAVDEVHADFAERNLLGGGVALRVSAEKLSESLKAELEALLLKLTEIPTLALRDCQQLKADLLKFSSDVFEQEYKRCETATSAPGFRKEFDHFHNDPIAAVEIGVAALRGQVLGRYGSLLRDILMLVLSSLVGAVIGAWFTSAK